MRSIIPREDFIISVCFPQIPKTDEEQSKAILLGTEINKCFRFCEYILISDVSDNNNYDSLIAELGNVRLLQVRHTASMYRKRVIAASEAIGDVVVLAATNELESLDVTQMIMTACDEGAIVAGERERGNFLSPVFRALGSSSGFRVTSREMLTTVYPRTLLNRLLANPDPELSMRFLPREKTLSVINVRAKKTWSRPSSWRELGNRFDISRRLLTSSTPKVLLFVSFLSCFSVFVAIAYSCYAIFIWIFAADVQPGWLTTSLIISFTATFLGVVLFGVSAGLLKIIELLSPPIYDDVIHEKNEVDLLSEVVDDLNVEIQSTSQIKMKK